MLNIPKIIPNITANINDITATSIVTESPLNKLGRLSFSNWKISIFNSPYYFPIYWPTIWSYFPLSFNFFNPSLNFFNKSWFSPFLTANP